MAITSRGMADETCPHTGLCQTSPSSSGTTSSPDLDTFSDKHAAWAGIAVVIVLVAVGAGVWYAIRRRRRARGGHNSVDAGDGRCSWFAFWRFWRGRRSSRAPERPISIDELERAREPKRPRPSSSASNLKRTTTAGTVDIHPPPAAKLGSQKGQYPMMPLHHPQLQSTETIPCAEPLPSHDASRNPRNSVASSQRSSLSRLSIPPPGLGPPVHRLDFQPPPHVASEPQN